jgi:hypothetical protein
VHETAERPSMSGVGFGLDWAIQCARRPQSSRSHRVGGGVADRHAPGARRARDPGEPAFVDDVGDDPGRAVPGLDESLHHAATRLLGSPDRDAEGLGRTRDAEEDVVRRDVRRWDRGPCAPVTKQREGPIAPVHSQFAVARADGHAPTRSAPGRGGERGVLRTTGMRDELPAGRGDRRHGLREEQYGERHHRSDVVPPHPEVVVWRRSVRNGARSRASARRQRLPTRRLQGRG